MQKICLFKLIVTYFKIVMFFHTNKAYTTAAIQIQTHNKRAMATGILAMRGKFVLICLI